MVWSFNGKATRPDAEASVEEALADLSSALSDDDKAKVIQEGFLPKARQFVGRLPFLRDMTAAYFCLVDRKTPFAIRAAVTLPLVYFVLPIDAIPDIIPAAGFTDDLAVWAGAVKIFAGHVSAAHYNSADAVLMTARPEGAIHPSGSDQE